MKSDRERLNWLEKFIRENSEIHLHDGGHPNGIGLGLMGRTLRQAIDAAMRQESGDGK